MQSGENLFDQYEEAVVVDDQGPAPSVIKNSAACSERVLPLFNDDLMASQWGKTWGALFWSRVVGFHAPIYKFRLPLGLKFANACYN